VGHDPAAQIRLETADQQEHAVIKTAFDPFVVAFHELAGAAFVLGKFELHDEHRTVFSCRSRLRRFPCMTAASRTSASLPA
jgi:hypothetical protein